MAKKSKTQRAKASARRQARKVEAVRKEEEAIVEAKEEEPEKKKSLLKRFLKSQDTASEQKNAPAKSSEKKEEKKSKEHRFFKKDGFFANVRKEMARVTWPTRKDVFRWTGVVLGALVFFGVFVFILDNFIVTPLLLGISSLGA